jgi:hypothetical protein
VTQNGRDSVQECVERLRQELEDTGSDEILLQSGGVVVERERAYEQQPIREVAALGRHHDGRHDHPRQEHQPNLLVVGAESATAHLVPCHGSGHVVLRLR